MIAKSIFQTAVEKTPDISKAFIKGLSALKSNSSRILPTNTRLIEGSVDIYGATAHLYPHANRWDYALGYNKKAYFIEIHPANSSNVHEMLKKLDWLKKWLGTSAPELNKIRAEKAFVWIQSGKVSLPKNTPQYRAAVSHHLLPQSKLILK